MVKETKKRRCLDGADSHNLNVKSFHTVGQLVPEEELDVDHGWSDFLHHVSDEVELVARAGSMRRTYTGKKN